MSRRWFWISSGISSVLSRALSLPACLGINPVCGSSLIVTAPRCTWVGWISGAIITRCALGWTFPVRPALSSKSGQASKIGSLDSLTTRSLALTWRLIASWANLAWMMRWNGSVLVNFTRAGVGLVTQHRGTGLILTMGARLRLGGAKTGRCSAATRRAGSSVIQCLRGPASKWSYATLIAISLWMF